MKLKEGQYTFESVVGRQFDDNIYELYQKIQQEEVKEKEKKAAQKEKRKQNAYHKNKKIKCTC